jgi:excisionase family DNA binding protein
MTTKTILPLLTKKEVCEKLHISLSTLDRKIKKGEIVGLKMGGLWRMKPENLERWIDQKQTA